MKYAIGIDNGLMGAIVTINEEFQLISYDDTPIINMGAKGKAKNEFATAEMGRIIRHTVETKFKPGNEVMAWIEQAQAMPKQGLSSTFKTGRGFGLWEGICIGLGIKYDIVHAKTWTKIMLHDVPRGEPKARSMAKCQRLFPDLPLKKPRGHMLTLDGRSDAALLAYYGMLQMTGQQQPHGGKPIPKTPPRRRPTLRY